MGGREESGYSLDMERSNNIWNKSFDILKTIRWTDATDWGLFEV